MVNLEWKCKICGVTVTPKNAWQHWAMNHPEMTNWAVAVPTDTLELPTKKTKGTRPRPKPKRAVEEDEDDDEDDLSLG